MTPPPSSAEPQGLQALVCMRSASGVLAPPWSRNRAFDGSWTYGGAQASRERLGEHLKSGHT